MYLAFLIIAFLAAAILGLAAWGFAAIAGAKGGVQACQRAIEIAARHGRVSRFHLASQTGLSREGAEEILMSMCRHGQLFEGPDGRYYLTPQKLAEESPEGRPRERTLSTRKSGIM